MTTAPTVEHRAAKKSSASPSTDVALPAVSGRAPAIPSAPQTADASRLAGDRFSHASIDRAFKANLARLTLGLSPPVLAEQTFDWLAHLAISPGKQLDLMEKGFRDAARFGLYAAQSLAKPGTPPYIAASPQDRRFRGEAWQHWPYNLMYQSFLLAQQWW
ncbi:MAG: polyhydroxyalkanoic acid synthase, partial [Alphaproteobacteria bacterium]|nr:polyhydroxyalkanoic acid synthase [Alphaproteobacteria bacterium]